LLAKTGQISWAGPAVCEGFGALPTPDDIMEDCFQDLMLGQGEGTGWRQLTSATNKNLNIVNATLWGGNLAMLVSLIGTPYFPSIKRGILFLEDVGEHPYRLERMLTQLLHAGVLSAQKAVVLGQFTDFKLTTHDKGFKLASVVEWLQSKLTTPILTNLPYGHVATKVLLPVGATVDLVSNDRDVMLVWGHTH
jgi:muramoyltetrapeptide carboxypeptidase